MQSTTQPIPPQKWSKDHWSMLAYVSTSFEQPLDRERLRCNEHNHAPLKGFRNVKPWQNENGTVLADGTRLDWHDDWDILEDLEAAGYLEIISLVNAKVSLTDLGFKHVIALYRHKQAGQTFRQYRPFAQYLAILTPPNPHSIDFMPPDFPGYDNFPATATNAFRECFTHNGRYHYHTGAADLALHIQADFDLLATDDMLIFVLQQMTAGREINLDLTWTDPATNLPCRYALIYTDDPEPTLALPHHGDDLLRLLESLPRQS